MYNTHTHTRIDHTSTLHTTFTNNKYVVICRDETIRSSHDTIRIDTKGDDMVIFDTIRYDTDNNCKNTNIHNVHIFLFLNTTEECFV